MNQFNKRIEQLSRTQLLLELDEVGFYLLVQRVDFDDLMLLKAESIGVELVEILPGGLADANLTLLASALHFVGDEHILAVNIESHEISADNTSNNAPLSN